MSRTFRHVAALALVALIGLISTGCSSHAPSETGTTSSSGSGSRSGSAGTGSSKNATHRDEAVKFAECMRGNGVTAFPDPDASGQLTVDAVANGSSVDTSSAAFEQALSSCKDLEPPGFTGYERNAHQQEGALRFAQCIRDNGVKDFPDPDKDQPLIDTRRIPSTATEGGMTILHAAMQQCRDSAAAAGVTGGP